jgi:endogenous inhibitor of DNA gyrase (YacG/DUF329 family)
MAERFARRPNVKCAVCGKSVYRRPIELVRSHGKAYCSSACYGISNRVENPCLICGTPILASKHKRTCSRACANMSRTGTTYKRGAPKDKVKDQRSVKLRLIAARGKQCERCAYSRLEILHVHHRDRNRSNNDLKNLELICPNCHALEHYLEKSWLNDSVSN